MIIQRRYECLGVLLQNDPKAKEAFYSAFADDVPADRIAWLISENHWLALHNADMGCGIPGAAYKAIMDKFAELDKTDPYDNGLTYRDVNKVIPFSSKSGKEISLILKYEFDGIERIVQVLSVRSENGKTKIADSWDPEISGKGI